MAVGEDNARHGAFGHPPAGPLAEPVPRPLGSGWQPDLREQAPAANYTGVLNRALIRY